jgi:flagellar FliL protein
VNDAADTDEFDDEADTDTEGDDGELESAKKKLSGKKIVLFFVLPAMLLIGAGGGLMATGIVGGGGNGSSGEDGAALEAVNTVFFDLPEMLVNLNTTGRRPVFLKMQVSLELIEEADIERLKSLSPRIIDKFQVYLRELRIDDLRGSAGIYRLREELLARVNAAVRPTKVKDVLFKEMLVQ